MRALELKIPPPVVFLVIAAAMWLVSVYAPVGAFAGPWRRTLAAVLAGLGLLLSVAGIAAFRRAGTTVHPHHPEKSSAVVIAGVYRFTRNPMYLGLLLVLAAWALWLAQLLAFALLPVFVAYLTRFQIVPEERALAAKFGARYEAYQRTVRRWL